MWKYYLLSVLIVVVIRSSNVCADQKTQDTKETDSDAGNTSKEDGFKLKSEPSLRGTKLDPNLVADSAKLADFLLERRLPLMLEQNGNEKRGRGFGFVGSRGRRRDMSEGPLLSGQAPLGSAESLSARLRTILEGAEQETFSKNKRRPHFGFHGSRG